MLLFINSAKVLYNIFSECGEQLTSGVASWLDDTVIVRFHCKNLAESQTVRRNHLVTQPADERNCGWMKISSLTLGKQGNRAQDL